jgi:4-hydroxy-3-methylbut-2-enyl diphosphate reductase
VVFVRDVDEVPHGAVVVLSAHGVAPSVRAAAAARRLVVVDATCPLVTKVHREAGRLAEADYDILLIGQAGHDEVIGTVGQVPGRIRVVSDLREAAEVVVRDPSRVAWLSQTTLAVDETVEIVQVLWERFPLLVGPPSDDVCYAAQNRQKGVRLLAARSDLMIVVGSKNSHNSATMARVARQSGAVAWLVDGPADCAAAWLDGVVTVGLTGGASAPPDRIEAVRQLRPVEPEPMPTRRTRLFPSRAGRGPATSQDGARNAVTA